MVVVAPGREKQRPGVAPHDLVQPESRVVKRGRPLQIAHKQVHVAHPAARRHRRPALAACGAKQIRHVERVRRHHEFPVLLPPGALRTVGVDLDPQPVRIAEVDRLAHQVVGHPGTLADLGQVPHEAAELRPVRQQDGEMVQAQPAAARHRRNPGALAQLDQRFPTLVRPERRLSIRADQYPEPEHVLVVRERPREVGHLQSDRPHPRGAGQAISRRGDAVGPRLRGHADNRPFRGSP